MLKKLCYLVLVLTLILGFNSVYADEISGKTIKKVISIVYDDSGSMINSNEDWAYASYSMQNLIGLLNSQDEVNVVKMSNPIQNINFDLSNSEQRKNDIKDIYNWKNNAGTPFTAVESAVNYLKAEKNKYNDSQTVEFWLVIITDGGFGGYPNDMNSYLNDLKSYMGNSKYEGIFVAIGNSVPEIVKNDWTSVTSNHLISASNSDDIVNAMFEVSGLILGQGGKNADLNIKHTSSNDGITFESYFPLKKFIVYEQNQNIGIKKIDVNETKVSVKDDFTEGNPGSKSITSRTIHCESDNSDYIPSGKIILNFDSNIDISNDKLKILTEPAVTVKLKILDKNGKEISDLNSYRFVEGQSIEFTAQVVSSVDGSPIDLKNWKSDLIGELISNNQNINMIYNQKDNTFYATYKINNGVNTLYSVITLPGYFRAKSDIISITAIEGADYSSIEIDDNSIDVTYKYTNDYEEISSFKYKINGITSNGICNFEFKNMPKGITASVNGDYADKNGKISLEIYNNMDVDIKLYRNKDYKEVEKSKILIDVTSDDFILEWEKDSVKEIILNPIKRNITIETIKTNDNSFKLNELKNNHIYTISVLADNVYLTKEELETLTLSHTKINGIKLKKEVTQYNGRYALKITCKKRGPAIIVQTGTINSDIVLTTIYGEKTEKNKITFEIIDSLTKYILPLIFIIVIILIIGYLPGVKKRINSKRYYIRVNGDDEAISVKLKTRLIPYISEKGNAGGLSLIATSSQNKILVVNNFDATSKILINGEAIDNTSNFELFVDDVLDVSELNQKNTYIYSNSTNDDYIDDSNLGLNDTDDIFTDNKKMKKVRKKNNDNDDEFFG